MEIPDSFINKIDVLVEKTISLEVTFARLDEKLDAMKESIDEIKQAAKQHYSDDERRFAEIERTQATAKGVMKAWVWVIALCAAAVPHVISVVYAAMRGPH